MPCTVQHKQRICMRLCRAPHYVHRLGKIKCSDFKTWKDLTPYVHRSVRIGSQWAFWVGADAFLRWHGDGIRKKCGAFLRARLSQCSAEKQRRQTNPNAGWGHHGKHTAELGWSHPQPRAQKYTIVTILIKRYTVTSLYQYVKRDRGAIDAGNTVTYPTLYWLGSINAFQTLSSSGEMCYGALYQKK